MPLIRKDVMENPNDPFAFADFAECLVLYRRRLRQMLYDNGVASNPSVDDVWILDQIEELLRQVPRKDKSQ